MTKNLAYYRRRLKKATTVSLHNIIAEITQNSERIYQENPDAYNRMVAWIDHALDVFEGKAEWNQFPEF